jgi:hypothetical protein
VPCYEDIGEAEINSAFLTLGLGEGDLVSLRAQPLYFQVMNSQFSLNRRLNEAQSSLDIVLKKIFDPPGNQTIVIKHYS